MCGGSHDETAVAVSSVAFNLSGPYSKRRAYVPTQTIGAVVSTQPSIPEAVTYSLLGGPGIKLLAFARWARTSNYRNVIGTPSGRLNTTGQIDTMMVADYIQAQVKEPLQVIEVEVQSDSVGYWVLKFVMTNYPERSNTAYAYTYNPVNQVATITWIDSTTTTTTIPDPTTEGRFLMAVYATLGPTQALEDPTPIPLTVIPEGEGYPLTVEGWVDVTHSESTKSETLYTVVDTVISYDDGSPDDVSTSSTSEVVEYVEKLDTRHLLKQWPQPPNAEGIVIYRWYDNTYNCVDTYIVKKIKTVDSSIEVIGGVTVTTVITTTVDTLVNQLSYTGTSTWVLPRYYDKYHLWEYKLGTGKPELDALFKEGAVEGDYIPYVPVRVHKRFISNAYPSTVFPEVKKAVRRLYNARYIELEKSLAKNSSIGEIDFAYLTFGASINTRSMATKKYLFEYFHRLYENYNTENPHTFESWQRQFIAALLSQIEMQKWYDQNVFFSSWFTADKSGIDLVPYPSGATFELVINSSNMTVLNYDQKITGQIVSLTSGTGKGWVGAKSGQVHIIDTGEDEGLKPFYAMSQETKDLLAALEQEDERGVGIINYPWNWMQAPPSNMALIRQVTPNNWEKIQLKDFRFTDRVYHGDYDKGSPEVTFTVKDAFESPDDSSFIIPFHEQVLKSLSIVDYTEVAMNGAFMLCNSFKTETYKVKSGGFLSIIISIVVVVIAIVVSVFMPQFAPAMAKAAAGTGAALGLTGTAAIVAGAAVNAIAGMVVSMIITEVATSVFGQKIGSIIAAVTSYIVMNVAAGAMSGTGNIFTNTDKIFSASNVLAFTSAVGRGWQGYNAGVAQDIQNEIMDVIKDSEKLTKDHNRKTLDVENRFADLMGFNTGVVDTLQLTATFGLTQDPSESRELFLQRTLLLGSDIADITNGYVTNFAETNLQTTLTT